MKLQSIILSVFLCCITFSLQAQNRLTLDSNTSTKSYDYSGYDAIAVSGDFKVNLTVGSSNESITVEANSNLMEHLDVYEDGNTLVLKFKRNWNWNFRGKMILNASISTRSMVSDYSLSGDAIVQVNNQIDANNVSMHLKGDSVLKANINAKALELMAKSDSYVTLNGTINSLDARLSSDSMLKGKELTVQDLEINLSGDSTAYVNVSESLIAEASGDSVLRYSGNPEVRRSKTTGDSDIRNVN